MVTIKLKIIYASRNLSVLHFGDYNRQEEPWRSDAPCTMRPAAQAVLYIFQSHLNFSLISQIKNKEYLTVYFVFIKFITCPYVTWSHTRRIVIDRNSYEAHQWHNTVKYFSCTSHIQWLFPYTSEASIVLYSSDPLQWISPPLQLRARQDWFWQQMALRLWRWRRRKRRRSRGTKRVRLPTQAQVVTFPCKLIRIQKENPLGTLRQASASCNIPRPG